MVRLFVSYRREDTPGHAGRLSDHLRQRIGPENVFLDVASLDAGDAFAGRIVEIISSADAVLVVIGRNWLSIGGETGARRIDEPGDWVRLEITTALGAGTRVVPVLVDRAVMPTAVDLPAEIAELAQRNAFEIRDEAWVHDLERLVASVEASADRDNAGRSRRTKRRRRVWYRRRTVWAAACIVAVFAVVAIWASQRDVPGVDEAVAASEILVVEGPAEGPWPSDTQALRFAPAGDATFQVSSQDAVVDFEIRVDGLPITGGTATATEQTLELPGVPLSFGTRVTLAIIDCPTPNADGWCAISLVIHAPI